MGVEEPPSGEPGKKRKSAEELYREAEIRAHLEELKKKYPEVMRKKTEGEIAREERMLQGVDKILSGKDEPAENGSEVVFDDNDPEAKAAREREEQLIERVRQSRMKEETEAAARESMFKFEAGDIVVLPSAENGKEFDFWTISSVDYEKGTAYLYQKRETTTVFAGPMLFSKLVEHLTKYQPARLFEFKKSSGVEEPREGDEKIIPHEAAQTIGWRLDQDRSEVIKDEKPRKEKIEPPRSKEKRDATEALKFREALAPYLVRNRKKEIEGNLEIGGLTFVGVYIEPGNLEAVKEILQEFGYKEREKEEWMNNMPDNSIIPPMNSFLVFPVDPRHPERQNMIRIGLKDIHQL